jgi:ABC-2 type transport system ATP-binding protein
MEAVVQAVGLRKRFGKVQALNGLTLSAPGGGVVAVLGPNGAGKTTFIRSVATLSAVDDGTLLVDGVDVRAHPERVRALIGLAGQHAAVEEAMTGIENLVMVARLFGRSRKDSRRRALEVLELLGLADAGRRLVRGWSGGMRRRLDLGASLVGDPRLLLLDEPTTGLDPASRIALWDAVRDLVAAGTDVLLTTQYLDEADHLADHVVIIDQGRTIATGTPAQLKARAGRDVIEAHPRHRADASAVAAALESITGNDATIDADSGRVAVASIDGTAGLAAAVRILDNTNLDVADLALRRPTLDEVFLALTTNTTDRSAA